MQENEQLTGLTKKQKLETTKLRSDLEKSVSAHKTAEWYFQWYLACKHNEFDNGHQLNLYHCISIAQ